MISGDECVYLDDASLVRSYEHDCCLYGMNRSQSSLSEARIEEILKCMHAKRVEILRRMSK